MKTLVLYPNKNQIKQDAKGAFIPEAKLFAAHRQNCGDVVIERPFDPHNPPDNPALFAEIAGHAADCVAFFTHGVVTGLPQLRINRADAQSFARALTCNVQGPVYVALYACLTDLALQGGRNFAETLADELHRIGKPYRLLAHRTAGHTTRNPFVTIYRGAGVKIEYPAAMEDPKVYRQRMADPTDPLRFELPF